MRKNWLDALGGEVAGKTFACGVVTTPENYVHHGQHAAEYGPAELSEGKSSRVRQQPVPRMLDAFLRPACINKMNISRRLS